MAGVVGVLSMAFLAERSWGVEERTLWNIPYYYLHEGRMAFPAYGYWYRSSYGSLFLHPPVHYFLVGGLMKLGLPLYYAEAAPLTLLTLACVAMVLAGGFRADVQLGLLAGLLSGIGWIEATGDGDYSFHLRPDAHMAMATIAGLLALEGARRCGWDTKRLFLGALLLTHASTVHYPGLLTWLGVLIYLGLAWRDLSATQFRARLLTVAVGGCVAGIPYLLWHVIPKWNDLTYLFSIQPPTPLREIVRRNFDTYAQMAWEFRSWPFPDLLYAAPLRATLALGIPPFALATALMAWRGCTRILAIAALPTPLYLFFLFHRKLEAYLFGECVLLLIGFWVIVALLCAKAGERVGGEPGRGVAALGFAALFGGMFLSASPVVRQAEWSARPRVHEMILARAAAKQVVGPGALVASIHSLWYLSGAQSWFDLTKDLLHELPSIDLRTYSSRFDAIAVPHLAGFGTQTRVTEASLYRNGITRLLGFGASRRGWGFRWVWTTARRQEPVTGFFWRSDALWRFEQEDRGDHVVVSFSEAIPVARLTTVFQSLAGLEYWALDLPGQEGHPAGSCMLIVLLDEQGYRRAQQEAIFTEYRPHEIIRGRVRRLDEAALLAGLDERSDRITFPQSYAELLAGMVKEGEGARPLEVKRYAPVARLDPVSGRAGSLRVTARAVGLDWLATAELPGISEPADYRVSFRLVLEAGGVGFHVLRQGEAKPLFSVYRDAAPTTTREGFVLRLAPEQKPYLVVSAYNPHRPAQTRVTLEDLGVERVTLSR